MKLSYKFLILTNTIQNISFFHWRSKYRAEGECIDNGISLQACLYFLPLFTACLLYYLISVPIPLIEVQMRYQNNAQGL
jgi:hypothetical protein